MLLCGLYSENTAGNELPPLCRVTIDSSRSNICLETSASSECGATWRELPSKHNLPWTQHF
eukprot:6029519-Amphidinium_carterae.1